MKKRTKINRAAMLETPAPIRSKQAEQARARANAVRQHTRERKARFDAAHAKGMDALAVRDHDALGKAIREEADLIAEQTREIGTSPARGTVQKRQR
jgi:hypothetical protein